MIYKLTDKLDFNDYPKIEIKGEILTVQSDAETILKIMDIIQEDEVRGMIEASSLLFSPNDNKKIKKLKLQFADYSKLIATAISLAIGEDPDSPSGE